MILKIKLTAVIAAWALLFPSCSPARKVDQDSNVSAFKYREVFLPEGVGKAADSLGLNTLDADWAIWGHNLKNVLPERFSDAVYAKVNGTVFKQQFCFTSTRLYDYLVDYINDQYGPNDHARFSIIPNDNDIVCLCETCVAIGNTDSDASPAVFSMIRKLSDQFPNHIFYASDYRTTSQLPKDMMPANTGVMVSAIDYPLSYDSTPQEESFISNLNNWSEKTPRILIWDYINNFDDYFTPFPIFGVMQHRLKNYRDNHVTAVFLNGSGYEPSSLSDLNTAVLAALTLNPDIDWEVLLKEKARELYPVTGDRISSFLILQENYVRDNHKVLPLYEGIAVAKTRYLPEDEFVAFHEDIKKLYFSADKKEQERLDLLLAELALTRLELNRINGNMEGAEALMASLEKLPEHNITSYNEAGWRIDTYLDDYRYMLRHASESEGKNKLKGVALKALTPLDEDYSDLSIITDGFLGLPSNYHNGHLITSPEKSTSILIPSDNGEGKLKVWLSYNPAFKIGLPESVTLSGEGMETISTTPTYPKDNSGHSIVEFDIPVSAAGDLTLTLIKDPETRSMALEEIEFY